MSLTTCRRECQEASRYVLAGFQAVLGCSVAVDTRHRIRYLGLHCSLAAAMEEDDLEEVLLNAMLSVVELAGWMRRGLIAVEVERMSAVDTTL